MRKKKNYDANLLDSTFSLGPQKVSTQLKIIPIILSFPLQCFCYVRVLLMRLLSAALNHIAVSSSPCQQKLVEERLFGIQGELQTVLRISETFACKYVLETKSRNSHQETLSDISGRNMSIIFKKYL